MASLALPAYLGIVVGAGGAWLLLAYVALQLLAALDYVFFMIGRYIPRATLWALRAEHWLGPWRQGGEGD